MERLYRDFTGLSIREMWHQQSVFLLTARVRFPHRFPIQETKLTMDVVRQLSSMLNG